MPELKDISFASPEVLRDPFPVFEEFRKAGGVTWSDRYRGWIVSSYDAVRFLLSHPRVSVQKVAPAVAGMPPDTRAKVEAMQSILKDWVVFNDPPNHTRLRKIIQRGFMPRNMRILEPKVREMTKTLVGELPDGEPVEFMEAFAYRLPAAMVCDLFGIPRQDAVKVGDWSMAVTKFILGSPDPERYDVSLESLLLMRDYFAAQVADRKANPRDEKDLVDALIDSQGEPGGMTDDEIVSSLVLIVFGGHETTANGIANAVRVLCQHPGMLEDLRRNPDRIGLAVEELLRFDGPSPFITRVASDDVDAGGQTIRKGDRIFIALQSANRDEAKFDSPEKLNLTERRGCPHIQFSQGMHTCVGAPLARLEMRVALEELLSAFATIELAEPPAHWRNELLARGTKRLMLRMTRAKID